jgi:alpha-L-rhamnosidase
MRFRLVFTLLFAAMIAGSVMAADLSTAKPITLRVEYLENPMGVSVEAPRFFWQMDDARRGASQSAYQILVADDLKLLAEDKGNAWDSGRVESGDSIQIVFAGQPLKACTEYYWKVRVWDGEQKSSAYCEPASFRMGMLQAKDVQAKWVGPAEPLLNSHLPKKDKFKNVTLDGGSWIWTDEPSAGKTFDFPTGERYFRQTITLPREDRPSDVWLLLAVDNNCDLFVNGKKVFNGGTFGSVTRIDLTKDFKAGENQIAFCVRNPGGNPNPAGLAGKLLVKYPKNDLAKWIEYPIDTSWKVSRDKTDNWIVKNVKELDKSIWIKPKAIVEIGKGPWGKVNSASDKVYGGAVLRNEFSTGKVKRAIVHASALGCYRLLINGKPVADDYFTPGWTDYEKRIYYNTYDVTDMVRSEGPNAIGVELAAGWYAGGIAWKLQHDNYGDLCKAFIQLEIEMEDGSRQMVVTDDSWRTSYGPRLEAEFLNGSTYDARLEMPGWATSEFNDDNWSPVDVLDKVDAEFSGYPSQPVRVTEELKPIKITEPKPGVYIYDMGQNFAGFARLKVKGPAGTKVQMRFAEMLDKDGALYVQNLRRARCTDTYILKGDPSGEVWQPYFTFHGFRYIEVTGYPGTPDKESITGLAVNSDVPMTGKFVCSSPMVNRLYQNVLWTQRANFIEVPTDCPQRDERLGWTGDAQCFVYAAGFNANIGAFFTKWLDDLEDAQMANGAFTDVAPDFGIGGGGTAGWADAGTICPMAIYELYGDSRILETHLDAMLRFLDYCKKNSKDLIRPASGYGDWLSIKADTPKDVMGTAFFAHSAELTAKAAEILGKKDIAAQCQDLFEAVKAAFNKKFVKPDGRIHGDTQTVYVLALAFDLLPEELRPMAAKHLAADIKARDTHLSTGFNGTALLMPTLSRFGEHQLAYNLLLNDTFPSWGYSIKHGATSIWERWDGWTADKGFQSPSMNSFAHYSFGAVARWMFQTVAGIETELPGYKQFYLRPSVRDGLDWAEVSYDSIYGPITSEWKKSDGRLVWKVNVPANTLALATIPTTDPESITESGKPLSGLKVLGTSEEGLKVELPAGSYQFESAWK